MEEIELKIKAVEMTQGKGKMITTGTEKTTLYYVEIPKHWNEGNIVLALVKPSGVGRL